MTTAPPETGHPSGLRPPAAPAADIPSRQQPLTGIFVKLGLFTVLSVVLSAVVVASLLNLDISPSHTYHAIFADASDLQSGDPVRIAGVEVGRVEAVRLYHTDEAEVTFKVDSDQPLTTTSRADIEFENLFGQHNLTIVGGRPAPRLRPGSVIPLSRTEPALDLSDLFNGFEPLFQALTPSDINELTANVIGTFQGQSGSISALVDQTASLTTNLADRQTVIDQVVDNLSSLLHLVGDHDSQLAALIDNFDTLTRQLSGERGQISSAIGSANSLVGSISQLAGSLQQPLEKAVSSLGSVTDALAANQSQLSQALDVIPSTLTQAAKAVQNGGFVNVYYCALAINVTTPVPALPDPVQSSFDALEKLLGVTLPYLGGVDVPNGQVGSSSAHSPNCEP